MSIEKSTIEMIELNDVLKNTSGSLSDMTSAFGKLSKSSTEWTIISRVLSGSPLWKLQNRLRAVGNVFFVLEERQKKSAEALEAYFKSTKKNESVLKSLQVTLSSLGKAEDSNAKKRVEQTNSYKSYIALYGKELGEMKLKESYEKSLDKAQRVNFAGQKSASKFRIKGMKEELKVLKKLDIRDSIPRIKAKKERGKILEERIESIKPKKRRPKTQNIGISFMGATHKSKFMQEEDVEPSGLLGHKPKRRNVKRKESLIDPKYDATLKKVGNRIKSQMDRQKPLAEGVKFPGMDSKGPVPIDIKAMKRMQKAIELDKVLKNVKKAGIFGAKTYETLLAQKKSIEEGIKEDEKRILILEKYQQEEKKMKDIETDLEKSKSEQQLVVLKDLVDVNTRLLDANHKMVKEDADFHVDSENATLQEIKMNAENNADILENNRKHNELQIEKNKETNEAIIEQIAAMNEAIKEDNQKSRQVAADTRTDAQTARQDQLQEMEKLRQEMTDEGLKIYGIDEQTELLEESLKVAEETKAENTDLLEGMGNAINKLPGLKQLAFIRMWWKRIKGFKRFKELGKALKGGLAAIGKFFLMAGLVVLLIGLLWRFGVIQAVWEFFTKTVPDIFKAVFGFFAVGQFLSEGVTDLIDGIKGLFDKKKSFWGSLGKIGLGLLKLVFGVLGVVFGVLIATLWAVVQPLFKPIMGIVMFLAILLTQGPLAAAKYFTMTWKKVASWLGKVILAIGSLALVIAASADWKSWPVAFAAAAVATGTILSYAGQMATGGVVNKTGNWLVGEQGPELVSLPQGARVHNNTNTNKMMGNNITINVQGRVGSSETELRDIARKVGRLVSQEINRTTSSSTIYR